MSKKKNWKRQKNSNKNKREAIPASSTATTNFSRFVRGFGAVAIPIFVSIALQMFGVDDPLIGRIVLIFVSVWLIAVCYLLLIKPSSKATWFVFAISGSVIVVAAVSVDQWFSRKRETRELTMPAGVLFADDKPSPQYSCGPAPPDAVSVYLGSHWMSWFSPSHPPFIRKNPPSYSIITVGDEQLLSVSIDQHGGLLISADVFDDRNDLVARIRNNEFVTTAAYRKRQTKSDLTVWDHAGEEILQVSFLNRRAIHITGVLRHPRIESPIIISDDPGTELRVGSVRGTGILCGEGYPIMFQ